ncbi:MAG: hemerythrin family protein [Magnetococcales bacterium]|nr:hemerythrin family protein [Magnetococcales bacterium]
MNPTSKAPSDPARQVSRPSAVATRDDLWTRWVMQTAKVWEDIAGIIKKTDVEHIDTDHKILTEITLAINNILGREGSFSLEWVTEQNRVLDHLYIFAEHHFQREERIIADYDLPNADLQKVQHEKFLAMVRSSIDDFQHGRLTVGINLKNRILEWWVNHINHLDHDTFCRENWVQALLKKALTWQELAEITKPSYIDEIDQAHRFMTEITLQLHDSILASGGQERMIDLFRQMEACAVAHFQVEEEMIRRHSLPGLEFQLQQHQNFLRELKGYLVEIQQGTLQPNLVRYQLLNWWIHHVNNVDTGSFALEQLADHILLVASTWEELSPFIRRIGVAVIDEEHRTITGYIMELNQMFAAHAGDTRLYASLQQKFDQLISSTRLHFAREEKIMAERQSQLAKLHVAEHHHFLSMVHSYQEGFLAGRLNMTRNLQRLMLIWWVNHISQYDYPTFGTL